MKKYHMNMIDDEKASNLFHVVRQNNGDKRKCKATGVQVNKVVLRGHQGEAGSM